MEQYTKRGLRVFKHSKSKPYLAKLPTLKFSISTSAWATNRLIKSWPLGVAMSTHKERLPRLAD